jgi:flagellar protein FliO/FliZ
MNVLPYASEFSGVSPGYSPWDVIWILFVLAVIIALIILLLKFLGKRSRGWGSSPLLRSLGGYPLGTNKSVQIIEYGGRIYVLGVGENITILDAITDSETVASLLAQQESLEETSGPALPEWMRNWIRRGKRPGGQHTVQTDTRSSFQQTLEQRLQELADRRQRAEQLLGENSSKDRSDNT